MKWLMQWRHQSQLAIALIALLMLPWALGLLNPTDTVMRAIKIQQIGGVSLWPNKSKRWALVIGVDRYADTQITTLGGSSNDAKAIANALVQYAGFPKDQVILLTSDQPAERQPTRGNILRRLSNLASVMTPDGLLFFSFAGHGMERNNQAFLLPSDSQVSNDVDLLEQTAINVAQIKNRIRTTGVKQVVMVLDACRNDPAGRANVDNPLTATYVRNFNFDIRNREVTAFATLYATAVGERAYEYTEKRQGYFTWELVEGLRGAAANEKGEITLSALLQHVQERVPKRVLADLGSGKEQRPFADIGGYQADQLVIAVASPEAMPKKPTTAAATSVNPDGAAFELIYWETIKNSKDPEDFKSYLDRYPNGQFTELALRRTGDSRSRVNAPAALFEPNTNSAPSAPPPDAEAVAARRKQISSLLAQAKANIASGALVQPAGASAADRYREVLKLQPKNAEATAGLNRIAELLLDQVEQARKANDVNTAMRLLSQVRSVQPGNPRIARLQADLDKRKVKLARREEANLEEANEHITRANAYLNRTLSLRNVAEANDHYETAASLAPSAPAVRSLRERILLGYITVAQTELNANRPANASKTLSYARKRNMSSPELERLEPSLQQHLSSR